MPTIALVEVSGNRGTTPPLQIESVVPILNKGVIVGVTVTDKLALLAHWPVSGVKVYVPEFWLSTVAGLHVPVIPFVDVSGNAGTPVPEQIVSVVPKLNAGVIMGFSVTAKEVVVAH